MFLQEIDLLDYSPELISFTDFTTYVHPGKKKRACTLVRNNIFKSIKELPMEDSVPQIWLQVEERSGRKTVLVNLYREWKNNEVESLKILADRLVEQLPKRIVVAGDFNLNADRRNDDSYNCKSLMNTFLNQTDESGFVRKSFGKTFRRQMKEKEVSSELDWVVSNCAISDCKTLSSGLSDHSLIIFGLQCQDEKNIKNAMNVRSYSNIDQKKFASDLANKPWEDLVGQDLNKMGETFNKYFLSVLNYHAPLKLITKRQNKGTRPSLKLKKLRRERDNARSKKNNTKLKQLRSLCWQMAKVEKISSLKTRIQKGQSEVWKIVREEMGTFDGTENIIEKNNQALKADAAAAEFNRYFIEKIDKVQKSIPPFKDDRLKGARKRAELLGLRQECFKLHTVTEKDIKKALKSMKGSKCQDYFGIAPAALKIAPDVVAIPLKWIINESILTGTLPECWKIAKVLPLHKKKERTNVENYRPIAILPSPSKIIEILVKNQLAKYLEDHKILPDSQFGFRRGLSTVQATGAAVHDWKRAHQDGLSCGALLFDLTAAFDTLDPSLLEAKLLIYGADWTVIKWIHSYLTGRSQVVDFNGHQSGLNDLKIGSPQGSVLSPLLFLVMVSDLEQWVTNASIVSYADDTTCYTMAPTKQEVRHKLEMCSKEVLSFMAASMLSANPEKTKFIMFGRKKEEPIKIGNVLVEESRQVELLGFHINKELSWSNHSTRLQSELKKRIGVIRRLSWKLPKDLTSRLIDPLFISKIYGLALLVDPGNENDLILAQLHKLHRQAMKATLCLHCQVDISSEKLYQLTGQRPILDLAKSLTASMAWKCLPSWKTHPLTSKRMVRHLGLHATRQSEKDFAKQPVKGSLISKMVDMWNKLPENIRSEKCEIEMKQKVKLWCTNNSYPSP